RRVDSLNMHTFYQRYPSEHHWTKDHPLEQVIGNPSQSVRTRRQLELDAEMCMFALTVNRTEPKNIKEAMADSTWIESMQEELHQFNRLDTLHAYFASEGILHQTSVTRTPEQNGVVERRNRYSTQSRAYRVFNKRTRVIVEMIHVNFDELPQMASDHVSSDPGSQYRTVTRSNELDLLFSPMFDELLNGSSHVVLKSSAVNFADASNQHQQQNTTPLNNQTPPDPTTNCRIY
nr:Gag-Pol polyprotein [Tanacetum cinerariifolium]